MDSKNLAEVVRKVHYPNYNCDNYYAYDFDTESKRMNLMIKITNFFPNRNKWCLFCNEHDVVKMCSGCKTVRFCNRDCQLKAWKVHKKHCSRDLFKICSSCGKDIDEKESIKCDDCPIKYCSEDCKSKIIESHKESGDCKYFTGIFK